MEATEYQVKASALRCAAVFASKDSYRGCLQGIYVGQDGIRGCDGKVAVRIEVGGDVAAPTIIPADVAKEIKVKAEWATIALSGDARLKVDSTEVAYQPFELPYPDVDKVTPKGEPVAEIAFNPAIAAELFKALAVYLGIKREERFSNGVTLKIYGPERAMVIEAPGVQALMMPCRAAKAGA